MSPPPGKYRPRHSTAESQISESLAGKIADALGAPATTTKLVIELDWRERRFTSCIEYDLTDEHGKVILEKIEEDKEET